MPAYEVMRLYVALKTYIYPNLPGFGPCYLRRFVQRRRIKSQHNVPWGPAVRKSNVSRDERRVVVPGVRFRDYAWTAPLRRAAFLLLR